MRNVLYSALLLMVSFSIPDVNAQVYYSATARQVLLRADSSSKSAVVSNSTDQRGDLSQLLAACYFRTGEGLLECRSYLSFNLNQLDKEMDVQKISSAKLILFPLQLGEDTNLVYYENSRKIVVRKVNNDWEDSLIRWNNQPVAADGNGVSQKIRPGVQKGAVVVDVTILVKRMLQNGDFGFVVSCEGPQKNSDDDISWFGSARNENIDARPVLLIDFIAPMASIAKRSTNQGYSEKYSFFGPIGPKELDNLYLQSLSNFTRVRDPWIPDPMNPLRKQPTFPTPGRVSN